VAELLKPPFNDKKTIDPQELLEAMVDTITNLEGAVIGLELQVQGILKEIETIKKGTKTYK